MISFTFRTVESSVLEEIEDMELVVQVASQQLTTLKRALNSTRPFYRLPPELSGMVIQMAVEDEPTFLGHYSILLPLRGVSFHFASIINSNARLWCRITAALHPDLVALALQKSGLHRLDVQVTSPHTLTTSEQYMEQICLHAGRWHALSVNAYRCHDWANIVSTLSPPFRELQLRGSKYYNIQTIRHFPTPTVASRLTHLFLHAQITMDMQTLTQFLTHTPNLQVLLLDDCGMTSVAVDQPSTVILPQLQSLSIKIHDILSIAQLLEIISCPEAHVKILLQSLRPPAITVRLLERMHALAERHHVEDDPETIVLQVVPPGLSIRWGDSGKVILTIRHVGDGDKALLYKHIVPRSDLPTQVWLDCSCSDERVASIKILDRALPKLEALWLLPSFDDVVIELLSHPVEKHNPGRWHWLLPNLVDFHIRQTQQNQTFDKVLELVEARDASEEVQSLTTLRLKHGTIGSAALARLKELVTDVSEVNVRII